MEAQERHEHRRAKRITHAFLVRYHSAGEAGWRVSQLRDLSSGGARFLSDQPFEVGAVLETQLLLPFSAQPVSLNARVAWTSPAPLGMAELGVTFHPGDVAVQRTIDEAVDYFLRQKERR